VNRQEEHATRVWRVTLKDNKVSNGIHERPLR
jgi:hypothetical protein